MANDDQKGEDMSQKSQFQSGFRRKQVAMFVQVLPGFKCEVEGESVGAVEGAEVIELGLRHVRGGADESQAIKALHGWLHVVEEGIRPIVKDGKDYILLAVRSLEAALYFFFLRAIEKHVLEAARKAGVEVVEPMDDEGGESHGRDEVYVVHVIVAICPQLGELRRVAGREMQQCACYADDGCEVFARDEFDAMLEKELDDFHGGSVAG